jgi:hypothetical protein
MTKAEGGQVLRDLQTMVHNRSDESVDDLLDELRAYLDKAPKRATRTGRDRMARGGRDRSE